MLYKSHIQIGHTPLLTGSMNKIKFIGILKYKIQDRSFDNSKRLSALHKLLSICLWKHRFSDIGKTERVVISGKGYKLTPLHI